MRNGIGIAFVSVVVGLVVLMSALPVQAVPTLEASTTWKDSGNTRVHGVFIGDVGSTSGPEVVTAGETVAGAAGVEFAELRVWEHSGSALTLKASNLWRWQSRTENVWLGVYAADVDGDGTTEIITVGYMMNASTPEPVVVTWTYDGRQLTEEDNWTINLAATFRSVHAANVYGTSVPEILVAGTNYSVNPQGLLALFTYDNSVLVKATHTTWGGDATAYSVHAKNIDDDSTVEIVTAGYVRSSANNPKNGEVRVWTYSGSTLGLVDDDTWQFFSNQNTVFYGVHNANVDNNAGNYEEMVACGFGYNSTASEDQGVLRIYRLVSDTITAYKDTSWDSGSETVCRSVYNENLDGDGYFEMTAGGWALVNNVYNGEIRTFYWEGGASAITEETNSLVRWYTTGNTKVNSVYDGNADSDLDQVEFVSGGQANDGTHDKGEVRVYHL